MRTKRQRTASGRAADFTFLKYSDQKHLKCTAHNGRDGSKKNIVTETVDASHVQCLTPPTQIHQIIIWKYLNRGSAAAACEHHFIARNDVAFLYFIIMYLRIAE